MSRPIITLGCRTSHGGTVISASPLSDIQGKAIARVGDCVSCPQCSGNHIIVSGDISMIVDGAAVARDGDKTSCGAILIADQHTTFTLETGFDAFFSSPPSSVRSNGDSSNRIITPEEKDEPHKKAYDLRFQIKGDKSGEPMAGMPYKITLENKKEILGVTDANGFTKLVSDDSALIAKLETPYYGDSTTQTNSSNGHDSCHC